MIDNQVYTYKEQHNITSTIRVCNHVCMSLQVLTFELFELDFLACRYLITISGYY